MTFPRVMNNPFIIADELDVLADEMLGGRKTATELKELSAITKTLAARVRRIGDESPAHRHGKKR